MVFTCSNFEIFLPPESFKINARENKFRARARDELVISYLELVRFGMPGEGTPFNESASDPKRRRRRGGEPNLLSRVAFADESHRARPASGQARSPRVTDTPDNSATAAIRASLVPTHSIAPMGFTIS